MNVLRSVKRLTSRMLMMPRLWQLTSRGATVGSDVRVYGALRLEFANGSIVTLRDRVVLNAADSHNSLEARGPVILKTLHPKAVICIGAHSGITSATISSRVSIRIGDRVLIGAGVLITDSDHHIVDPPGVELRRTLGMPVPKHADQVVIGDDVFIGARSIVLKGVTIGSGSVIGAGSVVTTDIPAMVVAAGNPCRVIRDLRVA